MSAFDRSAAEHLLASAFAPWLRDLDLQVDQIGANDAVLRMTFSDRLCRDNGVVCGQAIMSLADTAMVFAISAASGSYVAMTTVDQAIHFLRPALRADLLAHASVVRLGRTMAFGSVVVRPAQDDRPVAIAQTAYALIKDGT